MEQTILCLNGGSSSLKFAVYRLAGTAEERLFSGAVEAIGTTGGRSWLKNSQSIISDRKGTFSDHAAAAKSMFEALREQGVKHLAAAGHRIVHGGPKFTEPQPIDEKASWR
jgi:acetate kinase